MQDDDTKAFVYGGGKPTRIEGRTVVLEQTTCQVAGHQPYTVHSKFTILSEEPAPVVETNYLLPPGEWTEVPFDPEKNSLLVIRNRTGDTRHGLYQVLRRSTQLAGAGIVLVDGGWVILPGEAMRGTPCGSLRLRPVAGEPVKVTVSTFPR